VRIRLLGAVLAPLLLAPAVKAQGPAPHSNLAAVELEYSQPFTDISGVRELSDGRVVVGDAREKTLQIIDLGSGRATQIGSLGQGPGEYTSVGALLAAQGDTTWLVDAANGRLLIVAPNGRTAGHIPLHAQGMRGGVNVIGGPNMPPRVLFVPSHVDAAGCFYDTDVASRSPVSRATHRSVWTLHIRRWSTPSGGMHIVDSIQLEQTSGTIGRMQTRTPTPFGQRDAWTVGRDGSVVIARAAEYRVDRISPAGTRSIGPPIPYERLPVTEADKKAYKGIQRTSVRIGGLTTAASPSNAIPEASWPAYKPPFKGDIHIAPDGLVWIPVSKRAPDDPIVYDLIDASGRRVKRVTFPPRTALVGFGRTSVYTARTDDDDLLYLQRRKY
jgi:hypothetical protein